MSSPRHWFVSDTHFCAQRPEHIDAFERLCALPEKGDTLLLLGDIFEIWVTDDIISDAEKRVEDIIRRCGQRGVTVLFMHGNRDFMVGKDFQTRTGVKTFADPSTWQLPDGRSVVLTHGDWFCTDDANYRRYRNIIRNRGVQFCFRALPKRLRLGIANKIRRASIESHKQNGNISYDANQGLINEYFRKFAPINIIIMGHTHLPDLHQSAQTTRLVLGDWRETLWYGLASEDRGFELFEAPLTLSPNELKHSF